jgi:hypothetical protein
MTWNKDLLEAGQTKGPSIYIYTPSDLGQAPLPADLSIFIHEMLIVPPEDTKKKVCEFI